MEPMQDVEIQPNFYFPCGVYSFKDEKYISNLLKTSDEVFNLMEDQVNPIQEVYPIRQSANFNTHPDIEDFRTILGHSSWSILDSQGYDMSAFDMVITELWCQEHHKYSGHDTHIHGSQGQICGFYFLECEKDSIRALIHDPRDVKVYASLPQKQIGDITYASSTINIVPEPGMFMFMNTWMPHAFTRNTSDKPVKFIHFNIGVVPRYTPPQCLAQAEVI